MTQNLNARAGALRDPDAVQRMFDNISPRYDLMNRVMTLGMDEGWRRLAVREALHGLDPAEARVLDVATGTGDLALAFARARVGSVVGLDFSSAMIAAASEKSKQKAGTLPAVPEWVVGDAMHMPFPDASFDALTVSFGLRNMPDYAAALSEFARVLRPGGRAVCLELTPFRAPLVGTLFALYFHQVVPVLGDLLTGDGDAYRYLPRSVDAFPDAAKLAAKMRAAGFYRVRVKRLGFGTVALHVGVRKP